MALSKPLFEELDFRETNIGDLILRRRTVLSLNNLDVYEIILGDAFLMSSLFTAVEEALSHLGLTLAESQFPGAKLDVVVGGLGLGYTARTALDFTTVNELVVVDYLKPVIEWHEKGLVPLGEHLTGDSRCSFLHGDFFGLAQEEEGAPAFYPDKPGAMAHAILLDIDHSPEKLLNQGNNKFYTPEGLGKMSNKLHPGGVFGLWSDDPPDKHFMDSLEKVFSNCSAEIVKFYNPLQDRESASTVYLATSRP